MVVCVRRGSSPFFFCFSLSFFLLQDVPHMRLPACSSSSSSRNNGMGSKEEYNVTSEDDFKFSLARVGATLAEIDLTLQCFLKYRSLMHVQKKKMKKKKKKERRR